MKKLTNTIIFSVALTLIMSGFAPAQNVTGKENQPASEEAVAAEKEIEIERKKAEIAVKVAEKEAESAVERQKQLLEQLEGTNTKQVEAAKKQLEAQLDQLLAEQRQLKLQIPKIELAVPRIPHLQHSGSGAVLVIPAAEMKPEDLVTITEDMTVMSRIFDKKLSEKRLITSAGSLFVGLDPFGHNSRTTQAIYLDGYGALFLMKVNVPLSPTPEAQEEKETEVEDTDPVWTETIREIREPEEVGRRRTYGQPEEKYDAEKVAELKETLIKTLKHAANIQAVKPDQSVILTVIGGQSQYGTAIVAQPSLYGRRSTGRTRSRIVLPAPAEAETGSFLPTVLTICAKKSDIDAFAKGEISFDEFRERTRMFTSYAKFTSEGLPDVEQKSVAQVQVPVF